MLWHMQYFQVCKRVNLCRIQDPMPPNSYNLQNATTNENHRGGIIRHEQNDESVYSASLAKTDGMFPTFVDVFNM